MSDGRVFTRLIGLLFAAASVAVHADEVKGISCPLDRVIAAKDSVLLLPLTAERHGTNWPDTLPVRFASGETIDARVAWRYAAGRPVRVHWTSPPLGLAIRAIDPDDDSLQSPNSPILIARVPAGASGDIRVRSETVRVVWIDPPRDPTGTFMDQPNTPYPDDYLQFEIAPDRPDPGSPFEYWRWVLLASRFGLDPPDPRGSEIEQMLAEYTADLWRIGLHRLATATDQSLGVARECRDILTAIAMDDNRPIAAWTTDGEELSYLLSILLDMERSPRELVRDALAWADTRDQFFFWAEGDDDDALHVAVINAARTDRTVVFRWRGEGISEQDAIPIGISALPGRVTRVRLDRPATSTSRTTLAVESGSFRRELVVRRSQISAQPPGVQFGPLQPVLTLAEVQAGGLQRAAPEFVTSAMLRRIDGRWEVFFECFRPTGDRVDASEWLPQIVDPSETRGIDAVTVYIGPATAPRAVLTVPELGGYRLWNGSDDGMRVVRNSYEDRWYCRIVLPDRWIDYPLAETAEFGFVRTHTGTDAFETSPDPCPPWAFSPGRLTVRLTDWTDLPDD